MIIDTHINKSIARKIMAENLDEVDKHIPSGKLSASQLGAPLQWQILKVKGVPSQPFDEYTLRKFRRGKDVEKWFVENAPEVLEMQKEIEYRNCIGFIDAVVSSANYEVKCGSIPHEVKSVTNAKFKNIEKNKKADRSHCLQACMYAMALGVDNFAIDYVASDDYRILTMVYETNEFRQEVDTIIDRFDKQLSSGLIPIFTPEEPWQSNLKYSAFPEWMNLTQEEINDKFNKLLIK